MCVFQALDFIGENSRLWVVGIVPWSWSICGSEARDRNFVEHLPPNPEPRSIPQPVSQCVSNLLFTKSYKPKVELKGSSKILCACRGSLNQILFWIFLVLRQDLPSQCMLTSDSGSFCLCVLNAGVAATCYHTWLSFWILEYKFKILLFYLKANILSSWSHFLHGWAFLNWGF